MAALSTTQMQEHLEDLLSKTITLQPSQHIDRVYGANLDREQIAKQDALFISDAQQFVRSLGKHVHEGLDLVDLVQDIEFADLPNGAKQRIQEWAQDGKHLSGRWEKTIKDKQVTIPEAKDMQELCNQSVVSLYHLERDIGLYSDRPVIEAGATDFDEPLMIEDEDSLSLDHRLDHN